MVVDLAFDLVAEPHDARALQQAGKVLFGESCDPVAATNLEGRAEVLPLGHPDRNHHSTVDHKCAQRIEIGFHAQPGPVGQFHPSVLNRKGKHILAQWIRIGIHLCPAVAATGTRKRVHRRSQTDTTGQPMRTIGDTCCTGPSRNCEASTFCG